jgi:hypothetical protein
MFSDKLVKSALKLKKYQGIKYNTVARNIEGLIPPGSTGINHSEWTEQFISWFICVPFVHRALR